MGIRSNTYTQSELLRIMQRYNSTDRQIIKNNLQTVKEAYKFQNADIMKDFGYKEEKIKGWFNRSNPVVPIFEDALRLAVHYDFDITELIGKKEGIKMKRLLMLKPSECASGDTKVGKVYNITQDILNVWDKETDDSAQYEYNQENKEKYPNSARWIGIEDESSEDSFAVEDDEDRFIIFENDRGLAHELIDRMEGLDTTIVNMAMMFMKDK